MQPQGHLTLYADHQTPNQSTLWTSGPGDQDCQSQCSAQFTTDGRLLLLKNGAPYWQTDMSPRVGAQFMLNSAPPYLSIAAGRKILWSSNYEIARAAINDLIKNFWKNDHVVETWDGYSHVDLDPFILRAGESKTLGNRTLLMQSQGNLVFYQRRMDNPYAIVIWASGTGGPMGADCAGKCYARFQNEGNLVLYDENHQPYWFNTTDIHSGYKLRLSAVAPEFSIVDSDGRVAWTNLTYDGALNDGRGANWERAQLISAFRTFFLNSGATDIGERILSDWRYHKNRYNFEERTSCGSFRTIAIRARTGRSTMRGRTPFTTCGSIRCRATQTHWLTPRPAFAALTIGGLTREMVDTSTTTVE